MRSGPLLLSVFGVLLATDANASIMSVDYDISILAGVETIGSGSVADVALADPDFSGTDSEDVIYSFDFTGDVLELTVNLNGFVPLGTSVAWDFTGLGFTNIGEELVSVTRNGGNGGAAALASGLTAITIETPNETADGIYTYVFDITTNFSTPAAIPEPSSCALFLVGGLAAWRIRRKRAA